jgi:hypothetical protein
MDNYHRGNETLLMVVAQIAGAANTANEIAINYATPSTVYINHSLPPLDEQFEAASSAGPLRRAKPSLDDLWQRYSLGHAR